jgi:Uma2 family endonuclease
MKASSNKSPGGRKPSRPPAAEPAPAAAGKPALPTAAELGIRIDVSHLVTEDDTPVDNPFCEKQMRLLTEPLHSSWLPGMPFVAMANVGLYFSPNMPVFVPDVLVAVDVESPADLLPKENRAYFHWLYGKAPDIVVEIVSNKEGEELTRKMTGYAHHGVPYYVVYDPEGHIQQTPLRCFKLSFDKKRPRYVPVRRPYFPSAELGLVEWEGEYEGKKAPWIRWTDGSGVLIPSGAERAAAEKKRADGEQARAEAAQARAELLAEKLRELGIDPATVGK